MMELRKFDKPEEFLAQAQENLGGQETRHNLLLGIARTLVEHPGRYEQTPYMAQVLEGEQALLHVIMTPPFGPILAGEGDGLGDALELVAADMQTNDWPVPDINGPNPLPKQFAAIWAEKVGGDYELEMAQRVYEIREVTQPENVPGRFRKAGAEDVPLIAKWLVAFEIEALGQSMYSNEKALKSTQKRVENGDWFVWEDPDVVSICLRTRPSGRGISVAGVYTPPEQRRKGYASACVAALSQRLLDEGYEFCSLFTNLANPTSNSIYMQIGYRPVVDFDKYKFIEGE